MSRPLPIVWALLALMLWHAAAVLSPGSVVFAGPLSILGYMLENAGLLMRATAATTLNALWGFMWGNLAAMAMAGLIILVPKAERLTSILALVVFCLPILATGPILRVLSGPGEVPQIALAALAVYYTTYLSLIVGLRSMPQSWTDLMAIYGRGAVATLAVVRARASLPYFFVGLQIAAPAAFLGAMIGEFTGAERGLGVLTLRAMRSMDVEATWSLAMLFGLNRFFAKRPGDVWTFMVSNAQARETLLRALAQTFATTLPGYGVGLLLGVLLAMLVVLLPKIGAVVVPVSVALRAVPIITTAPLIVLALGRGAVGTITVVAVMIFFPTFLACLQGLRQTPGQVLDLFRLYQVGRFRQLFTAQVPAMLPAFFAAAKMAVPAAILAVTTTEWLATGQGVGVLMALTATTSDYNMLWSCIVGITLGATVLYAAVVSLERAVLRIYASEQVA